MLRRDRSRKQNARPRNSQADGERGLSEPHRDCVAEPFKAVPRSENRKLRFWKCHVHLHSAARMQGKARRNSNGPKTEFIPGSSLLRAFVPRAIDQPFVLATKRMRAPMSHGSSLRPVARGDSDQRLAGQSTISPLRAIGKAVDRKSAGCLAKSTAPKRAGRLETRLGRVRRMKPHYSFALRKPPANRNFGPAL